MLIIFLALISLQILQATTTEFNVEWTPLNISQLTNVTMKALGRPRQITTNKDEIWILTTKNRLFKKDRLGNHKWIQISGRFSSISAHGSKKEGDLWALTLNGDVMSCKNPCTGQWIPRTPSLTPAIGQETARKYKFRSLSAGRNALWAVSRENILYRCNWPCYAMQWIPSIEKGTIVSSGNAITWLLSGKNELKKTLPMSTVWEEASKNMADSMQIFPLRIRSISTSVNDDSTIVIDSKRNLLRFNEKMKTWSKVEGKMRSISVFDAFLIYTVDEKGNVFEGRLTKITKPCEKKPQESIIPPIMNPIMLENAELPMPACAMASYNLPYFS